MRIDLLFAIAMIAGPGAHSDSRTLPQHHNKSPTSSASPSTTGTDQGPVQDVNRRLRKHEKMSAADRCFHNCLDAGMTIAFCDYSC